LNEFHDRGTMPACLTGFHSWHMLGRDPPFVPPIERGENGEDSGRVSDPARREDRTAVRGYEERTQQAVSLPHDSGFIIHRSAFIVYFSSTTVLPKSSLLRPPS
jgi:hypothetical protein